MPEYGSSTEKNGFTLIEIITSVALLAMVIAMMLPIFPQILHWSSQSEDQLKASRLLERVAEDVEQNSGEIPLKQAPTCGEADVLSLSDDQLNALPSYDYTVEINVCEEETVDLYRTNIQIFSEQDKLLSESYTYAGAGDSE